jgi:membrane protease subunit HflK
VSEQSNQQDPTRPSNTSLPVVEEGLDPASQSLSDALRVSFKVLKAVMAFIVIAFLCSGFFTVEQNESVLVLRFGKLQRVGDAPVVHDPGFKVALPGPIDEKVKIKSDLRRLTVDTFAIDPAAGAHQGGLIPGLDGYMITADQNMIHATWMVTYRIDDPVTFVAKVADAEDDDDDHGGGKPLIRSVVENAVLRKAARYTSSEILLQKQDVFRGDVRDEVSARLRPFGIYVRDVLLKGQMSPPGAVLREWQARTAAAQTRAEKIQKAVSERSTMLNDTAGQVYPELLTQLALYEQARAAGDEPAATALEKEIETLMLTDASGRTARRISAARAFQTGVYEMMRADVKRFNELLPEYEKNPQTVAKRLWTKTKAILHAKAEGTLYAIPGQPLTIEIRPDPNWKKDDEISGYVDEVRSEK